MLSVRGRYVQGSVILLDEVLLEGTHDVIVTFLDRNVSTSVEGPRQEAVRRSIAESIGLTEREYEVLCLLAEGRANRECAHALDISEGTTRNYTSSIYRKLGVRNRTEAVSRASDLGIVE